MTGVGREPVGKAFWKRQDSRESGRGMMWVAQCLGKDTKAGRQGPVEKHQVIKFKYGKSRERIRRLFWGQAVESPNARLWSSYLIQWSAGSH